MRRDVLERYRVLQHQVRAVRAAVDIDSLTIHLKWNRRVYCASVHPNDRDIS